MTSLRKKYLEDCYKEVMEDIKQDLNGHPLWISIDETTDASFDSNLLKVIVTDAAPYMQKACRDLQIFFPSLLSVTCLAHGLHRVSEKVREMFHEVNELISNVKKTLLKAPSRILVWKEQCPISSHLMLPPEPIITLFYANHFEEVKSIIELLDPSDALTIKKSLAIVKSPALANDLAFIKSHLSFLPASIKKLEEKGLTVTESLQVIRSAKEKLESIRGEKGQCLVQKFRS
eukprot:maker-scaffold84_size396325-snap-gene-2.39 protein:Tk09700 transcript:maker-scaffold84_size396325-snap-gene-2.39-mRNA-1 annotation:"PREDICTED: uncharacterized protein LOC100570869"